MSPKSEGAGGEEPHPSSSSATAAGEAGERAVVPPGGRKRDTMIRELKSKLKEKFPTNTLASVALAADAGQRVTKPQFRWDRFWAVYIFNTYSYPFSKVGSTVWIQIMNTVGPQIKIQYHSHNDECE